MNFTYNNCKYELKTVLELKGTVTYTVCLFSVQFCSVLDTKRIEYEERCRRNNQKLGFILCSNEL